MNLEIVETSKRKPSAILDGYQYRQHRTNKEEITSWLCVKEKKEKCRGTLKTRNNEVVSVSEHSCKPDTATIEIKKQVVNAKKRARETDTPIAQIYREEFGPLFDRGYEFVANVPVLSSVKSILQRSRWEEQRLIKEPSSASEVLIPKNDLLLKYGTSFLLADDGDENRILIFASSNGREILSTHKNFFLDGTFKSCSKQFRQLYTVHADIGSSAQETNILPFIFALLKNKTQETYERFFTLLKNETNWNPESITIDFEQAVIVTLRKIIPEAKIYGCYFHFTQCLWRKVQDLGLAQDYKNNEDIRLHIRMCAALAYVPIEDVENGWLIIQASTPNDEKLQKFYDYFVDQWLENVNIPIKIWNCHGKQHRTNNAVEGWNNRLKHIVKRPNPRVLDLIHKLKEESSHSDFLFHKKELNLEGKRRKQCFVKLDSRINSILEEYKTTANLTKCLKTLAYVTKLE